jgi:hypothetical protein
LRATSAFLIKNSSLSSKDVEIKVPRTFRDVDDGIIVGEPQCSGG